ncbi:hypothetical protein MRX96_007626 [Rhipicephalus microplus]
MKIEQQAKKNVLNVKNEISELEAQVCEFKQSLAAVKQDALPQVPHTDAGSTTKALHNNALSTTLVLSPSVTANKPSDSSRAPYRLDVARKIYAVRANIIRHICENATIIQTSVVKANWKQQIAKIIKALQNCSEDNLKEYKCLDHFCGLKQPNVLLQRKC